ncbi:MAG: nucleotidyltransferase family protein [Bacteroidetes bacterium]|nr:nucleotidyltransferase family protein [Bacteroidota bacterium]MBK8659149.1 nucleotidyltransferase family protein [Bacteroidota bacterium]
MLSKTEILNTLRSQKAFLRQKFHVAQIGLFGSFARDENTEQSDIDFLVVIEPDIPNYRQTKNALREYLSRTFNKEVDLANPNSLKPHFKDRILKTAVYA